MGRHMENNREMKLKAENLKLKEKIVSLEDELRDCRAALSLASERADIDYLTGIYNRNGITRLIDSFLGPEGSDHGALCFLDLDNFKQINDRYGHSYGDEVLCRVVRAIYGNLCEGDVTGRFGGDEFIVFLRGLKGEADIAGRANAICAGIREGLGCHSLTASIGISRYPEDGMMFSELLEKADRALYQSKKGGKDRICFFWDSGNQEAEDL